MDLLAKRMDDLVVKWLVDHGGLPPWAEKAKPDDAERRIQAAARRLHSKLQGVFDEALDRLAKEMDRRRWPGSPATRRQLIDQILGAERDAFRATIVDHALQAAVLGRHLTVEELQRSGLAVVFDRLASAFVRQLRETTFQASGETMDRIVGDVEDVMNTLARQVEQGLGIADATRALRENFNGLQEHRLQAIAQTEIITAQNAAGHQTMVDYGVQFKQWLSSGLPNVRDSHRQLHGVVIRVGERYPNGLMYPGDRSGPIGEWIRCRCRERPYLPRRGEVITTTPYYP